MRKSFAPLFLGFLLALFHVAAHAQPFGGKGSFDGINDFAVCTDSIWLNPGDKTLELWISSCPNSSTIQNAGIVSFYNGSDSLSLTLNVNSNGTLANLQLRDTANINAFNIPFYSSNTWHHVALTYHLGNQKYTLHFDGDSLGQFPSGFNTSDSVIFGKSDAFLAALIDEIHISDSALYSGNFSKPSGKPVSESSTVELFSFNENQGNTSTTGSKGLKLNGRNGFHINDPYLISSDTGLCKGDSLLLGASGGTIFLWSPGSVVSSTTNDSVYFTGTNSTNLSVTISDTNGCRFNDQTSITVFGNPAPSLGSDTTICKGDMIGLNPGDFHSYLWSNGSVDSAVMVGFGSYWVRVADSVGCSSTDSIELAEYPALKIDLGGDTTVPFGTTFYLDAGMGFASYKWSTGENTRKILASLPILYSVTVTDSNGCRQSDQLGLQYNTVGVQERSSNEIRLFPNPVSAGGKLFVSQQDVESGGQIQIIDLQGKIYDMEFEVTDKISIDIPMEVQPGLYFILVGDQRSRLVILPDP